MSDYRKLALPPSSSQERTQSRLAAIEERFNRAASSKGSLIYTDFKSGSELAYTGTLSAALTLVEGNSLGTNPMEFDYTPPVDAWADARGSVYVQKTSLAYNYCYTGFIITPTDEDGADSRLVIQTQYGDTSGVAGPDNYASRQTNGLFKLSAGVAYNIGLYFVPGNGGNWRIYRGDDQLWCSLRVYVR